MEARCNTVLTIGTDVTRESALALAQTFFKNSYIDVIEFTKNSETFKTLTILDIENVLILGHGSHDSYGGLSPTEFAAAFAENFAKTFTPGSKLAVNHLYLVGCNIGMIKPDGDSIAQTIINELHARGFESAVLHCISHLAKKKMNQVELVVDVMINPGLPGMIENIEQLKKADGEVVAEKGFITVTLQQEDKVQELLIKGINPVIALNKAENTFVPNEKLDQRSERIAKELKERNELNLANVIKLLKIQRRYLQLKGGTASNLKSVALRGYIKELLKCTEENWKATISELANRANKNPIFNRGSTTLALINHINENNLLAVQAIQLEQSDLFADFVMIEEPESPLDILRDKAGTMDEVLGMEITRLKSSRFVPTLLFRNEIDLKQKKRDALQTIIRAETVPAAVQLAQQYKDDADVTKGRASRTSELLDAIIEANPVLGEAPDVK